MRVAVVGAGIAGLTGAWRLQQAGHQVRVLEAAAHPGGRMWTAHAAGFDVDTGAHMLLRSYARTRALVGELGLGERWFEIEVPEEGGILHDHQAAPFSPHGPLDVLRQRGVSLGGRLRLLLALFEARRWRHDLDFFDLSLGDDALDTEDCESFSRRRLGEEATASLVDAFIRTFHFHGAQRMSRKYFEALAVLLLTRDAFQLCALRGHMRVLPEALASHLDVRFGQAARAVEPLSSGVRVTTDQDAEDFDAALVATTADVARVLLRAPSPAQRLVLEGASYSSTVLCAFTLPAAAAGGFAGLWVPYRESRIVSGVSNGASQGAVRAGRCVFDVWLHEECAVPWLARPDQEIFQDVAREVERLLPDYGGLLQPLLLVRWPSALPVYAPGQVTRAKAFWQTGQGDGRVWLCGDYLNHPWVEGAVRSGEKAAGLIAAPS